MKGFFLSIDALVALMVVIAVITAFAGSHYAYAQSDAKLADFRQPARDFLVSKYFSSPSILGGQFGISETIPESGDVRFRAMLLAYPQICWTNNWEQDLYLSLAQAQNCLVKQELLTNTAHYAWVVR